MKEETKTSKRHCPVKSGPSPNSVKANRETTEERTLCRCLQSLPTVAFRCASISHQLSSIFDQHEIHTFQY